MSIKYSFPLRICIAVLAIWGVGAGTQPAHAQLDDDMLTRELAAPSGIVATPGLGRIVLTWDPSTEEGVLGYNLYRSSSYDGDYEALENNEGLPYTVGQTTYVDSGMVVGESFFYRVTSVTAIQESPFSEIAGATVEQRALSDFDTDFNLTPSAPSMSSEDEGGLFLPQPEASGGFLNGRRLAGIGFMLGSAAFVYKGLDFKDQADKLYDRYESATDPAEVNRLYQRTTNRDVKSQISWAVGAACAVAGVRLLFFGDDEVEFPGATAGGGAAAKLTWDADIRPGTVGLRLNKPF